MYEIRKILITDKDYPESLKRISNPPKVLYIKGELLKDEIRFAIVGTRKFSSYGRQVTKDIGEKLAEEGVTIVSGLAPGIDTFAHQAAVKNKRRTIAILGTGLDEKSIYPKENILLSREILKCGGCLISEYPERYSGSKFSFPLRNRIISGISLGVLVVEAKEKSGSIITADFAARQNKKIFAVPGSIYSLNSKGTNKLIKKGVKLVDNAIDIMQELDLRIK